MRKRANLLLSASKVRWYQEVSSNNKKYQEISRNWPYTVIPNRDRASHQIHQVIKRMLFFFARPKALYHYGTRAILHSPSWQGCCPSMAPVGIPRWAEGVPLRDLLQEVWSFLKKMYPKMDFLEIWRLKLHHSLRSQSNHITKTETQHRIIDKSRNSQCLWSFSQSKWSLIAEVISLGRGVFRLQFDGKVMVG